MRGEATGAATEGEVVAQAPEPPGSYQRWVARHAGVLYCFTGGVTLLAAGMLVRALLYAGTRDVVSSALLTACWASFTAQVWQASRTVAKYDRLRAAEEGAPHGDR